jgi:hypothetical protein
MATGQHCPAQPMGASHWVTLRLTGRPHVKGFSRLKIKPEINFWCRKNRLKGNKNLEKILQIEDIIWNNFFYWNFLPIFTDFEIN